MTDERLAQKIRDDGIDILIDLAGHTSGNRLLVFARKPAPIQVSWMGFGYTTGLTGIDYYIGDPIFTPPEAQSFFSETLYSLPHRTAVYQPPALSPEPGESPFSRKGFVTFGCLSRSERVNQRVISAWAEILRQLPAAHLRLDSRNFGDVSIQADITRQFASLGIPAAQLEIGYTSPAWDVYREVDIVLDCFPHNSGTTTYEALWMGIPVITMADRPSVGRSGASVLTCIGKKEWIASDCADYVSHAVKLASDQETLALARKSLRNIIKNSPLMDQQSFVHDMEHAYRDMWQQWCKNKK